MILPDADASRYSDTGVAGLLSATYHVMMNRIMDSLSAAGYQDLSKTQLHILARFDKNGMSLARLAQRVRIPLQVVANIVGMLSEKNYIAEVSGSEETLGETRYVMAPRGHQALILVEQEQRMVEDAWGKQLGQDNLRTAVKTLESLYKAVSQHELQTE